jgi:hypothetical protein
VSGVIYKGLILVLTLALGVSVTLSVSARQEMRAMAASNLTLRKTLGDMSIAITDREKDIDRLSSFSCGGKEKSPVDAGSPSLRASRP